MNWMVRGCALIVISLAINTITYGQTSIDFLDAQLNVVRDSISSKFIRTTTSVADTTYTVRINYRTGELMMTGAYKDKALSTEHGEFKYFYANGVVESQGRYANGNKVGVWNRWSYDGNPKPDRQYAEENFKKSTRTTASAKFPGGMTALQQMVNDSLVYPAEAIERKIEGTVYVTFVIDTSGDVRNAEVTGSVHYLLDEEALRFVSTMPTWTPATRNGSPVDSNFIMPITFGTNKGQ
jgi:TonB family protein